MLTPAPLTLSHSWDKCCSGTSSTYNTRVVRSSSITGPYVDQAGVSALNGGGTLVLASHDSTYGPGGGSVVQDGSQMCVTFQVLFLQLVTDNYLSSSDSSTVFTTTTIMSRSARALASICLTSPRAGRLLSDRSLHLSRPCTRLVATSVPPFSTPALQLRAPCAPSIYAIPPRLRLSTLSASVDLAFMRGSIVVTGRAPHLPTLASHP